MDYWFQWITSSLAYEKDLSAIEDDHVYYAIIEWDYLLVLDLDKTTDFPDGGLRNHQEDYECLRLR